MSIQVKRVSRTITWIVDDTKPDAGIDSWVECRNGEQTAAYWDDEAETWWAVRGGDELDVIAWAEMPEGSR